MQKAPALRYFRSTVGHKWLKNEIAENSQEKHRYARVRRGAYLAQ